VEHHRKNPRIGDRLPIELRERADAVWQRVQGLSTRLGRTEGRSGVGQVDLTPFMMTSMLVTMKSEVRSLRTAAGLSQGALATALSVSRQTINAIETGRYDPSLRLAAQLSRYFKQSIEEIFDVEEH